MKEEYEIEYEGGIAGSARVLRQGMHYLIRCRCRLARNEKLRIVLRSEAGERDLGLCVPMAEGMGMDTRVPVRQLGEGAVSFHLYRPREEEAEIFLPVREDSPFGAMAQLREARLAIRSGVQGVLLKGDYKEISRPTGQWSEPKT